MDESTTLVAEFADHLRALLDQIDSGVMEAEEETRLRIEGGVVALDAVRGLLAGEDHLHEATPTGDTLGE